MAKAKGVENIKYRFSGHQTFVFRHGWLEKGVQLIKESPRGFLEESALVKLGVGKNMVESIKYWCGQTGLLKDGGELGSFVLTEFAEFIFGKGDSDGVDPYLEDDATLWLLHYNLITNPIVSTWGMVFDNLNKPEFTKEELLQLMQRWLDGKCSVSSGTLGRDIDCFVRSYTGTRSKASEDNFDCPFLALSLMQATSDSDLYRLNICAKHNLPVEIIGYAALRRLHEMNSVSSSVQNMLFEPRSPGQIFKLDENSLMDSITELEDQTKGDIKVTESSCLTQINFSGNKSDLLSYADKMLKSYYEVKA